MGEEVLGHVKWFSELSSKDIDNVGEKAAVLSELYNAKFSVPPGFVIILSGFKDFKESGEIKKSLKDELEEAYDVLNIEKGSLNGEALSVLENPPTKAKVVVRVSLIKGVFEKLPFLEARDFESLIAAVKEGFDFLTNNNLEGALIIQKLANSRKSGFISKDPEKADGSIVAEAVWGLGSLMKKENYAEPDKYNLNSDLEIVKSKIGDKAVAFVSGASGIEKINVSGEDRRKQVLTAHELKKLSQIAIRVENMYSFPHRIDFCFEGDELFITGASPVEFKVAEKEDSSEENEKEAGSEFAAEKLSEETDSNVKSKIEDSKIENISEEELILKALDEAEENNKDEYLPGFDEKDKDVPRLNEAIPVSSKDFESQSRERIFDLESETNEIILKDVVAEVESLPEKKAMLEKLISGNEEGSDGEEIGETDSEQTEAKSGSSIAIGESYVQNNRGNIELNDEWEDSSVEQWKEEETGDKEEKDKVLDIF